MTSSLPLRLCTSSCCSRNATSEEVPEICHQGSLPCVPWDIYRYLLRLGVSCLTQYQAFAIRLPVIAAVGQVEPVLTTLEVRPRRGRCRRNKNEEARSVGLAQDARAVHRHVRVVRQEISPLAVCAAWRHQPQLY